MKNKAKRRIIWLDSWDIEELESWFSHMSLQGWRLVGLSHLFAKFEQCDPEVRNYRCDVFKLFDGEERIQQYKEAGWEHVGSRHSIYVFREINCESGIEMYTDASEQAESFSTLKESIFMRGILTLVLSFFLMVLALGKLSIHPMGNYIHDRFVDSFFLLVTYLFVSYTMVSGMIHMSKLMKKLKSGKLLDHNVDYKRKLKRKKWIASFVLFIVTLWVISVFTNFLTIKEERFSPIPPGELPVVQLSDFMNESEYRTDLDDPFNYFKINSSILVPKQYELIQTVEVPGVMWEDNSGTYQPAIWSYGYEVRTEWIAKKFVQAIIDQNTSLNQSYDRVLTSRFDELWVSEEDHIMSSFVAREDHHVFLIVYFGMEPIETMIEGAFTKITDD
ncbi:DUF2812 domain-containing protein [Anaerobacillus sp. MEB173]|uniref:DUF2812 domain-containing protein n=1 Tax=Anaerobacillus sp. MEB173 TaxID=3383345 RepID=UPI003F8E5D96